MRSSIMETWNPCAEERWVAGGGMRGQGDTILPDSLSTHLYPAGSVNWPSPDAPFLPGVVVRAAPVLRCTVPLIHLRRHPEIPNSPLLFRERSGERLFWDHWRMGEWGWMGVSEETYREEQGWREKEERRGERGLLMVESPICGTFWQRVALLSISWL